MSTHNSKNETIMLVDDEEFMAMHLGELLVLLDLGSVRLQCFNDLRTACASAVIPNLLIIDLSSMAPIICGPHGMWSPICQLIDHFPGAPIIINSAVSPNFAEGVKEEVLEKRPETIIYIVDRTTGLKDLEKTLRQIYGMEKAP